LRPSAGEPFQQQRSESILILEGERDRQRAGLRGKLRHLHVAGEPREVFFRRHQHQAISNGLVAQGLRLRPGQAMMVGKAPRRGDRDAGVGQR
jgi:hypothetical protein